MRLRIVTALSVALFLVFFAVPVFTDHNKKPETTPKVVHKKYDYHSLSASVKREIDCLVDNIFYESSTESHDGKIAVAFVTMNRVNSDDYPKTVCGVVKQKTNKVCQFSWYCQKKTTLRNHLTISQESLYNYIREIAMHVYFDHGKIYDPSHGALFYHATYVSPNWKNVVKTVKIGKHIFYK